LKLHEIVEFRIPKGESKANRRIKAPEFRRGDLDSSGICLEESQGRQSWRAEGNRRAGSF